MEEVKQPFPAWIVLSLMAFVSFRAMAIICIPPTYDEMIQLYMARDIALGSNFPIYFYDQQYMGPLESYVLAPFLRLFGFSVFLARLWYQAFYVVFAAMLLSIIRRLYGKELAVYTLALLCVLPFTALFFTAIVGYGEILALAVLAMLLLLRLVRSTTVPIGHGVGLGFLSGLAFWCNPIFVVWAPSLALGLFFYVPALCRKRIAFAFAAGLLAGLFPMWIHALQTGVCLKLEGGGGRGFVIPSNLLGRFYQVIASLKGFFCGEGNAMGAMEWIPLLGFAISFFCFFVFFIRTFRKDSSEQKVFKSFIVLPPLILFALYTMRDLNGDEGLRFFLPLLISYAFVVAWQIQKLRRFWLKNAVMGFFAAVLVCISLACLTHQRQSMKELRDITHFLQQNNLCYGIADVGVVYGLNALSQDKICATTLALGWDRYKPFRQRVFQNGVSFVVLQATDPRRRKELEGDARLSRARMGKYDVFYGSSPLLQMLLSAES